MKHTSIFSTLLGIGLGLLGLSGCVKEQALDTNQLSDTEVRLLAIAPNPVARGAALRIVGSNLQLVEKVIVPGIEPITEIEVVKKGKDSEIRVILPLEGPEVGPVSIEAKGKVYSSSVDLEYVESIILEEMSPLSALPGDVITFKGEFLSNIQMVTFGGNAVVTEFAEQSRHELKVVVPANAVSGKIILSDVDENNNPDGLVANLFYSAKELVIGDPTVKAVDDLGLYKAGAEVKVNGEHLDMIEKVNFEGVNADFSVNEEATVLTAVLPAEAKAGAFNLISYAGKTFKAGAYTTVVPSEFVLEAERFKAGNEVTLKGKDLDLVTSAFLSGVALDYLFDAETGNITFAIPATSADGVVSLGLANGEYVDTDAIELVKPVIASVSPLELYAGDGNVTVEGTDLDLVVAAKIGGVDTEIAEGASDTVIELVSTATSVGGKVELVLANSYVLASEQEITFNYHSLVVVSEMPAAQHIGEEVVLKGTNFDLVENIFIGDTKVTSYSLRTPEEVRFIMPWLSVGPYPINFHLYNGDVETLPVPIEVQLERIINTIWEGKSYVTWSGGAVTALSWGGYDWSTVAAGTTLLVNVEVVDADAVIRFGNGGWTALPTTKTYANADGDGNLAVGFDITAVSLVLSNDDLDQLVNAGGLVICGTGFKVYSVELVTEIPQETTIFEGPCLMTWGDDGRFGLATSYFEGLKAGSKMIIYFTQTESWGQVQINDGSWSDAAFSFPELGGAYLNTTNVNDPAATKIELTLTQEILDHIASTTGDYFGVNTKYKGDGRVAMVLQGSDWIIDKITVK